MLTLSSTALELLVAPVVIIPACGLLVLSISARMNAVIGRTRGLHRERIDVYLHKEDNDPRWHAVRTMRIEGLDTQADQMLHRCQLMQHGIRLLYGTVICLVITSLLLGLSVEWPALQTTALIVFGVGMFGMLAAMVVGIREVSLALEAVRYEHGRVANLCDQLGNGDKA